MFYASPSPVSRPPSCPTARRNSKDLSSTIANELLFCSSGQQNQHCSGILQTGFEMVSLLEPSRRPLEIVVVSALIILLATLLNSTSLSPFRLLPSLFNAPNPIVHNTRISVSYRGTSANGVEQFQNIFFAEDTSGSNRFAPPVPYVPPPGTTVDATAAGAWCPQGIGGPPLPWTSPITNVSENCLSLRVARPTDIDASARLPVLVWMHGGMKILWS